MKAFQDFNSPHILYHTFIPSLLVKAHSHFQVRSKQARRSRQKDISAENRYGILLSWQQSAARPLWVTQLKHQANWKGQDRWKTLLAISLSFCYQRLRWGGGEPKVGYQGNWSLVHLTQEKKKQTKEWKLRHRIHFGRPHTDMELWLSINVLVASVLCMHSVCTRVYSGALLPAQSSTVTVV